MNKPFLSMLLFTSFCMASTPPDKALIRCDASGKKCIAVGEVPYVNHGDIPNINCLDEVSKCNDLVSYVSYDGKQTWQQTKIQQSWNNRQYLKELACDTTLNHCVLVGSVDNLKTTPMIVTTFDGGYNWLMKRIGGDRLGLCSVSPLRRDDLNSVDIDLTGNNWVAVGGCVYKPNKVSKRSGYSIVSNDGGQNWHYSEGFTFEKYSLTLDKVVCSKVTSICKADGISKKNSAPISFISYDSGENWELANNQ